MALNDRRDPLNAGLRLAIRREVRSVRRGRVRLAAAGFAILAASNALALWKIQGEPERTHRAACRAVDRSNDATYGWLHDLVASGSRADDPEALAVLAKLRSTYDKVSETC